MESLALPIYLELPGISQKTICIVEAIREELKACEIDVIRRYYISSLAKKESERRAEAVRPLGN